MDLCCTHASWNLAQLWQCAYKPTSFVLPPCVSLPSRFMTMPVKPPMCSHTHVLVFPAPLSYVAFSCLPQYQLWNEGTIREGKEERTLHLLSLRCTASGGFRDRSVSGWSSLLVCAPVVSSTAWERSASIRYTVTEWCLCRNLACRWLSVILLSVCDCSCWCSIESEHL